MHAHGLRLPTETTTDVAVAVPALVAAMKTGATTAQIEEALTRRDGSVGYRCRCPHCQELAQEWAETFVPPTHRIIALDDLQLLWDGYGHLLDRERDVDHAALKRIEAIIEGDDA